MSLTLSHLPSALAAAYALPAGAVLLGALAAGAAFVLLLAFRPLLAGLARAFVLLLRPRLSRDERAARGAMRDTVLLQRLLNAGDCDPSHAAELRALAAHG